MILLTFHLHTRLPACVCCPLTSLLGCHWILALTLVYNPIFVMPRLGWCVNSTQIPSLWSEFDLASVLCFLSQAAAQRDDLICDGAFGAFCFDNAAKEVLWYLFM